MKHLKLSRRAKATKVPGPPDFGRPLNERGLRDAPEIGRRLKKRDEIPDHIVSSHARRALTGSKRGTSASAFRRASKASTLQELQGGLPASFS
jgi:phosphohistidine phosphatase SixA